MHINFDLFEHFLHAIFHCLLSTTQFIERETMPLFLLFAFLISTRTFQFPFILLFIYVTRRINTLMAEGRYVERRFAFVVIAFHSMLVCLIEHICSKDRPIKVPWNFSHVDGFGPRSGWHTSNIYDTCKSIASIKYVSPSPRWNRNHLFSSGRVNVEGDRLTRNSKPHRLQQQNSITLLWFVRTLTKTAGSSVYVCWRKMRDELKLDICLD